MNVAAVTAGLCICALQLSMVPALGDERTASQMNLISASSNCPAGALDDAIVAVEVAMPASASAAGKAAVVNRFRYNYLTPATSPRATIAGEIRDFGAPGCTGSFAGNGLRYD